MASRYLIAGVASALGLLAASPALALPQCQPASPEHIARAGFYVDNAWQKYRTNPPTTPEHRCCARVCEPIIKFAAAIEKNAMALNDIARNPKVPQAERDRALAKANALFSKRSSLAFQFLTCLAETRPTGTGSAARCGQTTIAQLVLDSYAWCTEFAKRQQRFRDLLVSTVGNSVGSWQAQSNWFRIKPGGVVEDSSVSMKGEPSTHLPAGKGTVPFKALITNDAYSFPPFPDGLGTRMYMRFTASAVRLAGPAGTRALDTSVLIDGVCPGPRDRPAGLAPPFPIASSSRAADYEVKAARCVAVDLETSELLRRRTALSSRQRTKAILTEVPSTPGSAVCYC